MFINSKLNKVRIFTYIFAVISSLIVNINAQTVKYAPAWFGPNANPVPEFTDGRIPAKTSISLMGDYYFGYGDETKNGYFKIEIPLVAERVSFKIWSTVFEHYKVTPELSDYRQMNGNLSGKSNGDFYVQTRISLLKEKKYAPAIILNSTLKTASGTNFNERRYFDTPGYYFDVEFAKSVYTKGKFINELRAVGNLGFLCWETTGSRQNDAPMYGAKIIAGNQNWKLDNTLSGYWGWMHTSATYGADYGDAPLVYAAKLTIMRSKMDYFAQYQYGINDFPYHQLRLGISFPIEKLTPKF
ncbi:MAG: hypothetical protein VB126_13155 [Paludibacter sp.]|nr:hypothetical protein [Paludibacter sp.]